MMSDSNQQPESEPSAVRPVCGVLAALFGVVGAHMLYGSISSTEGWSVLLTAIYLGHLAFTYTPSTDTNYSASRPRLLVILGICVVPPLLLLFLFGNRPHWFQPLLIFFLLSISVGPVILLRRYARHPNTPPNDRNS